MAFVLGRMPLMMSDRNLSLFVIKLLLIGINAVNSPFLGMQLQKYDFYLFLPNKSLIFYRKGNTIFMKTPSLAIADTFICQ